MQVPPSHGLDSILKEIDMTDSARKTLRDFFKSSSEFDELMKAARRNAETEAEKTFLKDFEARFNNYGADTIMTEKQLKMLESVASTRVKNFFESAEDFQKLLKAAEETAATDWAKNFIKERQELFAKYGMTMRLTEKQLAKIKDIADGKLPDQHSAPKTW
jgi:hypothetical protein